MRRNCRQLCRGESCARASVSYNRNVEAFKKDRPDFEQIVNQLVNQLGSHDVAVSLALRDEILTQPNGPSIAHFLGTAPEVVAKPAGMHPQQPRRDTYDKSHGSGTPHIDPGELQKIWHGGKPAKPKK